MFNGFHENVFQASCGQADGGFWAHLQRARVPIIHQGDLEISSHTKEKAEENLARARASESMNPCPFAPVPLAFLPCAGPLLPSLCAFMPFAGR